MVALITNGIKMVYFYIYFSLQNFDNHAILLEKEENVEFAVKATLYQNVMNMVVTFTEAILLEIIP